MRGAARFLLVGGFAPVLGHELRRRDHARAPRVAIERADRSRHSAITARSKTRSPSVPTLGCAGARETPPRRRSSARTRACPNRRLRRPRASLRAPARTGSRSTSVEALADRRPLRCARTHKPKHPATCDFCSRAAALPKSNTLPLASIQEVAGSTRASQRSVIESERASSASFCKRFADPWQLFRVALGSQIFGDRDRLRRRQLRP